MPDNSKITLKQLKDAMNMVKAYVDAEIRAIGDNNIPCTGIVLDKDTLSFTTTDTQTLVATVTPTNCTDTVTWSVSPTGIATVNNGVVTPVANGECTITATCGSYSDTCTVSVSGMSIAPGNYTLLCGNLDYTGRGNGPIMGTTEDIVPMVFRRDFDTSNHTTLCSNKTIKRICLRFEKAGKLTIGKVDLTQHGKNANTTIIDPVQYDVVVGLNELDVNISCGAHESLAIGAVGDTGLPLFSYTVLTPEQVKGFPVQTNKDFKAGANPTGNVALLGAIYI